MIFEPFVDSFIGSQHYGPSWNAVHLTWNVRSYLLYPKIGWIQPSKKPTGDEKELMIAILNNEKGPVI